MLDIKMYISGDWREAQQAKRFAVINPATGETIGSAPLADETDVAQAAENAHQMQKTWGKTNVFARGAILRRAASAVEAQAQYIAEIMTAEQGKTLQEARQEVIKGAQILRFYAEEGERICGRIIPNEVQDCISNVIYQPVGTAGAIIPWNYPIELLAWKVGAAIAAGCAIVCKLPYETPLSPTLFVKCIVEAGLPENVVQTLTGRGSVIGMALARDPRIHRLSFTGSTAEGRQIAAACADQLKHVSLELGGSLPMLVFDDCDLEAAVKGCIRRSFRNNGQICIAINRVYVQRGIYDAFVDRLAEETAKLRIGNAGVEEVDVGPMCTCKGLEKVMEHVEDARSRGARIVAGGKKPQGEKYANGYFYEPTVIADAAQDMLVMSEETFGPAIGVTPFDTIEDAVALANESVYGLAAICYTNSLKTANRIALDVDAGNVAINNVDAGVINAPYGGWKDSGIGCEHGREGLFEYLRAKHVRIHF